MLRGYLEKITGLATGSDGDITRKLVKDLLEGGFGGEGLANERVQVVKTHFPERFGTHKFTPAKAIMIVRNPLDAMVSLFNMLTTSSHTFSIADEDFKKYSEEWDTFVKNEASVWSDYHKFWMSSSIPVHVIKFEDLLTDPEPVLESLLSFVLDSKDLSGTRVARHIEMAVAEKKAPQKYKPREGKINTNLNKFSKE